MVTEPGAVATGSDAQLGKAVGISEFVGWIPACSLPLAVLYRDLPRQIQVL